MAASILTSALPVGTEGDLARAELVATGEDDYEGKAIGLANGLVYAAKVEGEGKLGVGKGRLVELRKLLYEGRWESRLFDTRRWVRDLEEAYGVVWGKWAM